MESFLKTSVMVLLIMTLSSCTFLSRAQVQSLRDSATLLDKRAEINDAGNKHLAKDLGSDHGSIKLIDQNSELERTTASTIRELVGSCED